MPVAGGIWRHRVRELYREGGPFNARDLSARYGHGVKLCYGILNGMRRRGEVFVIRRGPSKRRGYVKVYAPVLGPADLQPARIIGDSRNL